MRVFVYGSLMSGMGNHAHFLGGDGATPLGPATIRAGEYKMIDLGAFPGLVRWPGGPPIVGELYEVDDAALRALDRLEGHPHFYRREPVILEGESSRAPIAYVLTDRHDPTTGTRPYSTVPSGDWRAHRADKRHQSAR